MANVIPVKTPAETALGEAFGKLRETLPGGGGVLSLRDGAIAKFREKGLPHRRVEEWKYTDLRNLMREANPVATGSEGAPADPGKAEAFLAGLEHIRLVVLDGAFSAGLSTVSALPPGLHVTSLAEALARGVAAISVDPSKTSRLADSMLTVTERMWHGWLAGGALTSQADELPGLRVPSCSIIGGKDVVVDQAKQLDDVRRIPGGRAVLLSDLGHLCGLEMPDVVANEITAFLRTVDTGSG